ncbi:MAG TPA: peptidase E [Solirubrobacteraceae bacterium]|nr:peptidase E [Solirubrobacteraceae bacterium]
MSGHIVAMGGATLRPEDYDPRLDAFVLSLARRPRPRVCFVGTASGDSPVYVANFHRAFSAHHDCEPSDLALFERTVADLRGFVLEQDVVYVGGGNTVSLLAVWRAHGLDVVLREAWERGTVLCGSSAGMNCWFEASTTDSFDLNRLAGLNDGLGLLPGSACPHYDGEEQRRPVYRRLVGEGALPPGHAADDAAALVFEGTSLAEVVTTVEGSTAYRVDADGESALPARLL